MFVVGKSFFKYEDRLCSGCLKNEESGEEILACCYNLFAVSLPSTFANVSSVFVTFVKQNTEGED